MIGDLFLFIDNKLATNLLDVIYFSRFLLISITNPSVTRLISEVCIVLFYSVADPGCLSRIPDLKTATKYRC